MTEHPKVRLEMRYEEITNGGNSFMAFDNAEIPFNPMILFIDQIEYDDYVWEIEGRYFSVDRQKLVLEVGKGDRNT